MGMPDWWARRRYGLFIHASLATVPAWSPIGQYSDWYWSHLGDDLPDTLVNDGPLVEVLAHHRERWGHIERFDDFRSLLTFDRFDADEWARLAIDAGMGYTVLVSKHHDGWCWWDAPNTRRTFLEAGPRRNVLAEYAAACARHDLVFGTYYSLLDWGDPRYPGEAYVTEVLHPHVQDLVDRFGSRVLWGDGHWGHGPQHWRSAELLGRMRAVDPEIVLNDRWWVTSDDLPAGGPPTVRTYEYETPDGIVDGPWELCRGIGHSFCHNRAERAEHHLTGADIVALYTEVLAKGGNLLLNVGPALDGTVPELQTAPLRAAGRWIGGVGNVLAAGRPWHTWGDADVRYLVVDGRLHAVDVGGRGHLGDLDPRVHRVDRVERIVPATQGWGGAGDGPSPADVTPVRFRQEADGVRIEPDRRPGDAGHRTGDPADIAVYRLTITEVERPVELFDTPDAPVRPLARLLDGARPGDVVQLADGVYAGPGRVPEGVVLRGLGPDRTAIDGGGRPAVELAAGARLEHIAVRGTGARVLWFPSPAVEIRGRSAVVLSCDVDGHIAVHADDALVRATRAAGVVVRGAAHLCVSRSVLRGNRWDVGVQIDGGGEHVVDSCQLIDHLVAIRCTDTTGTEVRANDVAARWCGAELRHTEQAHVHANRFSTTMRAVHVVGGTQATIDGNAVFDGDSGCVLERGAASCQVSGNHWERCRIGLLAWDATDVHATENQVVDLHEPEHATIVGP